MTPACSALYRHSNTFFFVATTFFHQHSFSISRKEENFIEEKVPISSVRCAVVGLVGIMIWNAFMLHGIKICNLRDHRWLFKPHRSAMSFELKLLILVMHKSCKQFLESCMENSFQR